MRDMFFKDNGGSAVEPWNEGDNPPAIELLANAHSTRSGAFVSKRREDAFGLNVGDAGRVGEGFGFAREEEAVFVGDAPGGIGALGRGIWQAIRGGRGVGCGGRGHGQGGAE